jgi:hypothetical protein
MLDRSAIAALALVAALCMAAGSAGAQEPSTYPDWSGAWRTTGPNKWDPTKPPGLGQQAPLIPEYQRVLEASLADQKLGGTGNDPRYSCIPSGMPRMMTAVFAFEFAILPGVTHMLFENTMPRRIYTDGRAWPAEIDPSFTGTSIGRWLDEDADGHFDVLEIETRGFKGPRVYDPSGLPLHSDNETIVKERIYLDKSNANTLRNDITTIDHALTRPWTVNKTYRRQRNHVFLENDCNENNPHVSIGKEVYYLSGDRLLMPQKKDQRPPDLRYFNHARN